MAGFDRFNKVWASLGLKIPASDAQADTGFAFLGPVPPSVELFNDNHANFDEKDNWLYNQIQEVIINGGFPPNTELPTTQLLDSIRALCITAGQGVYVAKVGDSMSGNLSMLGPEVAINYNQPTTLLFGPWTPEGIGFGWDGAKLRVKVNDLDVGAMNPNGGGGIYIGDVPPTVPPPAIGDLWWNSIDGNLYIWYDDSNSAQWVPATASANPIGGIATPPPAQPPIIVADTPPATPAPGDLWWNSAAGNLFIWYDDGTSQQWVASVANSATALFDRIVALEETVRQLVEGR